MFRKAVLWLVTALLLGVGSLVGQTHMYNLEEFEPTPFHYTIYIMMEQCTGVEGDFSDVRWYIASTIVSETGINYWGVHFTEWGWSAIVLEREKAFTGEIVSHEIMHNLYNGQGPMDTYRKCVLDWSNLTPIIRPEGTPGVVEHE